MNPPASLNQWLSTLAPYGALAGTILLWLLNRRTVLADKRVGAQAEERTAYIEGGRAMLAELRACYAEEKASHNATKLAYQDLMDRHLRMQQLANEVVAKYDLVRNLAPGDERFPPIKAPLGTDQPSSPKLPPDGIPVPGFPGSAAAASPAGNPAFPENSRFPRPG